MERILLNKLKKITLITISTNQVVSSAVLEEEKSNRRRRRGVIEHIDDKTQINMLKEQW